MSSLHPFSKLGLILNSPEPALICRHHECRYVLQPAIKRVHSHLWEKHGITKDERRGLTACLRSLQLADPRQLLPRKDGSELHPDLARHVGYVCRPCGERSTSVKLIDKHIRERNGADYPRQARDLYLLRDKVHLQSWVQEGPRRYWIIRGDASLETTGEPRSMQGLPLASPHLSQIYESERARIADTQMSLSRTTVEGGNSITQTTPWMRRTRWFDTYRGARRDILVRLTAFPNYQSRRWGLLLGTVDGREVRTEAAHERRLESVLTAVDRLFDRCEETYGHTGSPILCWLYSQHPTLGSRRPFRLVGRRSSVQKYRRAWKRFILFLLRLHLVSGKVPRSALNIRLSNAQRSAVERVLRAAGLSEDLCKEEEEEESPSSALPADDRSTDLYESSCDENILGGVVKQDENTSTNSGINFCDGDSLTSEHDFQSDNGCDLPTDDDDDDDDSVGDEEDDEYEDHEDDEDEEDDEEGITGRHRHDGQQWSNCSEPESTFVHQDALISSVLQLSIFFATERFTNGRPASSLLVYFSGILGFSSDGATYRRARDFTSFLSALIHQLRLLFLEWALPYRPYPSLNKPARPVNDHLTPLNRLRHQYTCLGCLAPLPEFISLLNYGRRIAPLDGPTFRVRWSHDGNTVSFEGGSLTMDQFRALGHTLLDQASKLCDELMYHWLPPVRLDQIHDDLNNSRHGFSFVNHPANHQSEAHLELFQRACTAETNGLFSNDRWNMSAVRRYLALSYEYLRLLMCIAFCLGGQGPRATELFTLECTNGEATWRGSYVYDGYLTLISRYSKSRHATGKDFHVVRYLPHRAGVQMFYYLVYIRRLGDMLRRKCQMGNDDGNMLFSTGRRVWTSADLTHALRKFSQPVCQQAIGSKLYRQLSIAVTEKHVRQILKSLDLDDDRSSTADLNVVFAWQSGHRPKIRSENYGLDGAFPDSLQPSLLRAYEWASVRWHQFLRHESKKDDYSRSLSLSATVVPNVASGTQVHSEPSSGPQNGAAITTEGRSSWPPMGQELSLRNHSHQQALQERPQPPEIFSAVSGPSPPMLLGTKRHIESGSPHMPDPSECRSEKRFKLASQFGPGRQPSSPLHQQVTESSAVDSCYSSPSLPTPPTTPPVPPQIFYMEPYGVVICLVCQAGVRPGKGCEIHWRNKHQLNSRPLQALLSYMSTISCCDPHCIDLPPRGSRAILELGTPFEEFSCPDCAFLTTNKKKW